MGPAAPITVPTCCTPAALYTCCNPCLRNARLVCSIAFPSGQMWNTKITVCVWKHLLRKRSTKLAIISFRKCARDVAKVEIGPCGEFPESPRLRNRSSCSADRRNESPLRYAIPQFVIRVHRSLIRVHRSRLTGTPRQNSFCCSPLLRPVRGLRPTGDPSCGSLGTMSCGSCVA